MNSLLYSGALTCALLPFAAATANAEMMLRYVEGSPNRGAKAIALEEFGTNLSDLTNNELGVEFHWGGALLKWGAILDGVAVGTADMGTLIGAYNPKELQALRIGDLPIGDSGDAWVGSRAMYDLMTTNPDMIDALSRQNVVYFGAIHTTAGQFMCNGADIKGVADLQGKKVRGAGLYSQALSDMGATSVSLTFGDIYQSLDSGLLDCSQVYLYTIDPYKFWEVIDQVLVVDWGQVVGIASGINKDVYDGLTEDQQAALIEAGVTLTDRQAQLLIEQHDAALNALENDGYGKPVQVIHASADDTAMLADASEKYIQEWKDEFAAAGYDADAAMTQYRELLAKYTKERDEKGYPWTR
ncbi:C4-dicarboxylate TRAP transporter substrate-binding protein [Chachezhania antarctica]|uniref:C4-dicarboxylate TRAP transporter substrate-binding protein n=1 Tax=Chachezhania antarctica TaxID=2340860 RepID=UPI0013CEE889|nr:C4-dicarboxylate TRAP transporter substrate-binding protein [Chachezhania antarctica]|tara:strand:- start:10538 stop:11605 length:1068 start_codon:yes stop_codon:yes gene_type:complete